MAHYLNFGQFYLEKALFWAKKWRCNQNGVLIERYVLLLWIRCIRSNNSLILIETLKIWCQKRIELWPTVQATFEKLWIFHTKLLSFRVEIVFVLKCFLSFGFIKRKIELWPRFFYAKLLYAKLTIFYIGRLF